MDLKEIETLKAGYVSLLNGKRERPDTNTYIRLCKYVCECHKLSGEDADEMISLLKTITHINGKEVPVPKSFRKLHLNVAKRLRRYAVPILAEEFDLPKEIFGENCHESGIFLKH